MTDKNTFEEIVSGTDKENAQKLSQQPEDLPPSDDSSLEALINQEQTLARRSLQKELGREPTQEEVDEWLSAHTESY
jgi:hypothetical protein